MQKPSYLLVPPFPGLLLRRAVAYWVLLHILYAALLLAAAVISGVPIEPAELLPGGNPLVPAAVVGLGMLQARRSDEDLFLANLGYGWPTIATYLLVPAGALEAAFAVARFGWAALAASMALPLAGHGGVLGP